MYAPQTQSGGYFNDQERTVSSLQWVEALSLSRDLWRGQHVFKIGTDLQLSNYEGTSLNRPIEVRRLDGSLAERTDFGGMSQQKVEGSEFATFAQDRWRLELAGDLRVRPAPRSRRGGRADQLVAARRHGRQRPARGPGHRPRGLWQVPAAHAAQRRCLPLVRGADHHAVRG